MYTIKLPIDHIAFSTNDRPAVEAILHKLGFTFGDTDQDAFLHVMFDNGYLEWVPDSYDDRANLAADNELIAGIRAYYAALSDAEKAHDDLIAAGYPTQDTGKFTRYAKHGVNHGMATFRFCGLQKTDLFGKDVDFGCVQQCDPQLIYDGHYRHVNDADTLLALLFVCADPEKSRKDLSALADALSASTTTQNAIEEIRILSRAEYAEQFGCPAPDADVALAAVLFSAADQHYLRIQLDALGLPNFTRGDQLYADVRKPLGAFFVFEGTK